MKSEPRVYILLRLVLISVLTFPLAGLGGCGSGSLDVDKAALYTPESLASEFILRFRQLSPDAQSAAVRSKPKDEKRVAEQRARSEQAKNKVTGGPPAKKKQTGPPSVDDLLADIDKKLDLINGVSRSDACRKMTESISGDGSLSDHDKKRLTELVAQMDGSHSG